MYLMPTGALYTCKRTPLNGHFYNHSKVKVGKQLIENILKHMDKLKTFLYLYFKMLHRSQYNNKNLLKAVTCTNTVTTRNFKHDMA